MGAPVRNSISLSKYISKYFGEFIDDENITEICYNGDNLIWTLDSSSNWQSHQTDLTFEGASAFSQAVAAFQNQEIQEDKPILSATLPNGQRVQVVSPNATKEYHISITIRKPSNRRFTLDDYEKSGIFKEIGHRKQTLSVIETKLLELYNKKDYKGFLTESVKAGKNIIISGETGSGKTTFMKSLIEFIPENERLITIEDVEEIKFYKHKNFVQLFYPSEAKPGDPLTSATLLKSCLRMKPDRILLAELRGGETFDYIDVINSGHNGSITSCHAGSVEETFTRLALMARRNENGQTTPHEIIEQILHDLIDIVVHMHEQNGTRYITDIYFKGANNETK